jgi:hypothetical protein
MEAGLGPAAAGGPRVAMMKSTRHASMGCSSYLLTSVSGDQREPYLSATSVILVVPGHSAFNPKTAVDGSWFMVDGSDTVSCDNSGDHHHGERPRRRTALARTHEPSTATFRFNTVELVIAPSCCPSDCATVDLVELHRVFTRALSLRCHPGSHRTPRSAHHG